MDQRHSRLVRRHHPHRGTHFPDRRLVPLGQATSDHLLGADPRSPRRLRPTGPALHRPRGRPDPGPGVGLSCVGNWRSPSRRRAPIWAWRPSASGPTWPSLAPPPSCWVSSPGPPWPPTPCKNVIPSPNVPRPGTTSRCPASTKYAELSSLSFAGSPPLPGAVAGRRRCGSWARQTPVSRSGAPPGRWPRRWPWGWRSCAPTPRRPGWT